MLTSRLGGGLEQSMRILQDKNGFAVKIDVIRGEDAYAGMIEGTPYLARRFRLLQGQREMGKPGHFVHGLDELEREIGKISPPVPTQNFRSLVHVTTPTT